jgi:hypothetical protein
VQNVTSKVAKDLADCGLAGVKYCYFPLNGDSFPPLEGDKGGGFVILIGAATFSKKVITFNSQIHREC